MSELWVTKMPSCWKPGDCPNCSKGQWCKFYSDGAQVDPDACLFGTSEIIKGKHLDEAWSEREYLREPR
jgi:hypothetical protein